MADNKDAREYLLHRSGPSTHTRGQHSVAGRPSSGAAAFLRNSYLSVAWNSLQNEAQRLGAPLQIGEDTAAILFLIVVGTRIPVGHAVPEGVVEQDRDFAGGRRHGLCLAGT